MAENTVVSDIEWLYPDLISEEGLIFILRQRFIRLETRELESLQKPELVELYNRHILPLPQRKYRNNRRGQEMTRKQLLIDKKLKRKASEDSSDMSKAKKEQTGGRSCDLINNFSRPGMTGDRLKPPPSQVDFGKKVVKLNSSKPSKDTISETDSIVIKEWNKKGDSADISLSENNTDLSEQTDKDSQSKKRSHSISANGDNSQESPQDSTTSPDKKKIAKITWP